MTLNSERFRTFINFFFNILWLILFFCKMKLRKPLCALGGYFECTAQNCQQFCNEKKKQRTNWTASSLLSALNPDFKTIYGTGFGCIRHTRVAFRTTLGIKMYAHNSASSKICIRVTARRDMVRHCWILFSLEKLVVYEFAPVLCAVFVVLQPLVLLVSMHLVWAIHPVAAAGANPPDFCSCTIYKCYGNQLLPVNRQNKKTTEICAAYYLGSGEFEYI